MHAKFWSERLKDLGVNWRIILEWISENNVGTCGLIHLTRDRDQWRCLVNTVVSLQIP